MRTYARGFICSYIVTTIAGCTPKVYLIDRQTVLEQEASASWPELDKVFYAESLKSGPTPLQKAKDSEAEKLLSMTQTDGGSKKNDQKETEKNKDMNKAEPVK